MQSNSDPPDTNRQVDNPLQQDDDNDEEQQSKKFLRQEEEANQRFLELLQKGRGGETRKRRRADGLFPVVADYNSSSNAIGDPSAPPTSVPAAATLPTSSSPSPQHAVPLQFGQRPTAQHNNKRKKNVAPPVGIWEKHTKGIGMKLLSKMGYSGSGGLIGGAAKRRKLQQQQNGSSASSSAEGSNSIDSVGITTPLHSTTTSSTTIDIPPTKTGISAPLQVKVRPANLGLGYGSFQEATSLASNRKIEAEVRGVSDASENLFAKADSSKPKKEPRRHQPLPWKRNVVSSNRNRNAAAGDIPNAMLVDDDVLQEQPTMKIIDMRGPNFGGSVESMNVTGLSNKDDKEDNVPLAEELLHNVTIIRNKYETRIQTAEHFLSSHQRQLVSLQAETMTLMQQRETIRDRNVKLDRLLPTLNELETILVSFAAKLSDSSVIDSAFVDSFGDAMRRVHDCIQQLASTFTKEERVQLRFSSVLIPTLLGSVIQPTFDSVFNSNCITQFSKIHTCGNGTTLSSLLKSLIRSALLMDATDTATEDNNDDEMRQMRDAIIQLYVIPTFRRVLESSQWDPATDYNHVGLQLYEVLQEVVNDTSPQQKDPPTQQTDWDSLDPHAKNNDTSTLILKELVQSVVYPKLTRWLLHTWKPRLQNMIGDSIAPSTSSSSSLVDRPDLWVLPWMPHIADDKAAMPALVADCKRTMQSVVSFLSQSIEKEEQLFLQACIECLRPWRGVFKKETIHGMISTFVTPRVARYFSKYPVTVDVESTGGTLMPLWAVLDLTVQMHSDGLMSDLDLVCVLEGELLPNWAHSMHNWLLSTRTTPLQSESLITDAIQTYFLWKTHIFGKSHSHQRDKSIALASYRLLQEDASICSCFYAVVLMLHACRASENGDVAHELEHLQVSPSASNYRIVMQRRKAELKQRAADDLLRMEESTSNGIEARVRLQRTSYRNDPSVPTFRDVVAEYARERDILFQPRLGHASTVDGKQVFLFGTVPIYLDGNVAYASQGLGVWKPMSLDDIAQKAVG